MKYTHKITAGVISFGAIALLVSGFAALPASALTVGASVSANTSATQKVITESDTDISTRITALNNLSARIDALQNVSSDEKASLSSDIQTNQTGLTNLQATIDAGGSLSTLRTDEKSIFGSYRIYALVIPQGWITASGDRVETIVGLMTTLSTKLQARITAAGSTDVNATADQASLSDMNAKISDADTQAEKAMSSIADLVPDKGDANIAASNRSALVAARADIKVSTTDLQAARKDVQSILNDLKIITSASATASASAGTQ